MQENVSVLALRIGGWANILIGVGHLLAMARLREISEWVGGPGDGRLSALHPSLPYLLTFGTGLVFVAFGLYALSACGGMRRLPFSTLVVLGITWIYVVRTIGGVGIGGFLEDAQTREFVFSSVALVIAVLYGIGARYLLAAC